MTLLLDGCNKLARHEMSRVGALPNTAEHSTLPLLAPRLPAPRCLCRTFPASGLRANRTAAHV